jgi:quinol monooxygenase YgiN
MISHVVMWTLHDPQHAARFKELLESCRGVVPGIVEFYVGIRQPGLDANVDVVLLSTFTNAAALDAYQNHPHHKEVVALLGPMRASRHVLDWSFGETRA